MKRIIKTILLVKLLAITVVCQTKDSTTIHELQDRSLYLYPTTEELKECIFDNSLIQAKPISEQDINDEFSNISDLEWLKDIAHDNKVLLLGEGHWHKYILNIRNRIFFYLNKIDYYPLIVLEYPYSLTGYINYFIKLDDEKAADTFFRNVLCKMIYAEDDYNLLKKIRKWNKLNPLKEITVGCSDVEHNFKSTINDVLLPYFRKMDKNLEIDTRDLKYKTYTKLGQLLPKLYSLLKKAEESNIYGDYPFISPQYISNVISNLESLYNCSVFEYDYYRQKAIVRNLTDDKYLGKFFTSGKVLLHGGAEHMTTHFAYPDNGNFFREGSYLNEDYPQTKGKVYSIYLHSFYISLGKAAELNLDSCVVQGEGYRNTLHYLQRAYKDKLISCDDFLIDIEISDFHKLFLKKTAENDNNPIVINSIDWKSALEAAQKTNNNDLIDIINGWEMDHLRYDRHIFIPGSPLIKALETIY